MDLFHSINNLLASYDTHHFVRRMIIVLIYSILAKIMDIFVDRML